MAGHTSIDDVRREWAASGVMMIPIPRAGILHEVRGQDRARAVPGIAGLELTIGPGRHVYPPTRWAMPPSGEVGWAVGERRQDRKSVV